jgi:hypothetical protein
MVKIPIDECHLLTSRHFKETWMKKWDWDYHDLREAIRDAYRIEAIGKKKFEAYVRKKGNKKLIMVYDADDKTIYVITGTEGKE